jgi:beta-lactamase superfamily II metal-dependent hydrolase
MSQDLLRVTLIDVGWGDSILLEARDDQDDWRYALIDSNDTGNLRSSQIFLQRFFERRIPGFTRPAPSPVFDWVLLSHAHADHGQGLKSILRDYGATNFWHSKTNSTSLFFTDLLRYARRSSKVRHFQSIDDTKTLPPFGQVDVTVLWPPHNQISSNENNNSVVLLLEVGDVSFVLTGDAEADVWDQGLAAKVPANTAFFKLPHHGSENGLFHGAPPTTPWLDRLTPTCTLAISSHVRPFAHPSPSVIEHLQNAGRTHFRTDEHYHTTIATDGDTVTVKYSHA